MRYFVAACLLGLGLGVALGLLLVTLGEAWESFDPIDIPAVFGHVARGAGALRARVRDVVDTVTNTRRAETPTPPARLGRDPDRSTSCAVC